MSKKKLKHFLLYKFNKHGYIKVIHLYFFKTLVDFSSFYWIFKNSFSHKLIEHLMLKYTNTFPFNYYEEKWTSEKLICFKEESSF